MRMMDTPQQPARPDTRQVLLTAEAARFLVEAAIVSRFFAFRHTIKAASQPLRVTEPAGQIVSVPRIVRAVEAAARRLPVRAVCLQKGVALQRMCRRRGIDARLHYGVSADGKAVLAHVWVSVDDEIVMGGANAATFAKVATWPASQPIAN